MEDTAFEIQILVNDRWSVLATADKEEVALQCAEDAWNKAGCQGIRVVARGATVVGKGKEREILSRRRSEDQSDRVLLGHAAQLPTGLCESIDDFVQVDMRRYLGALMRPYTDHHQLTTEEFLFLPALAGSFLENDELAPMAISRVASEQAHAHDLNEPERRAELWQLCEGALKHLRKVADKIVPITDDDFGAVFVNQSAHADWVVMQSLAADLSTARGLAGKFERLLTLLEHTRHKDALATVDAAMAGLLGGIVGRDLFGEQPNLAGWIGGLVALQNGQAPLIAGHADDYKAGRERLIALIQANSVPQTVAALQHRAWHLFSSHLPLSKNKPGDERRAVQTVIAKLIINHDFDHPAATVDALTRRCMRLSESGGQMGRAEAIQLAFDILPDRAMGIIYLLHLSGHEDYQDCRRQILAMWLQLLSIDRPVQLLSPDLSMADRFKRINHLAKCLTGASLPRDALDRMRDILTHVFDRLTDETGVLDKIDKTGLPSEQRSMSLLGFATASTLLSPEKLTAIHQHINAHEDEAGFRDLFSPEEWHKYQTMKQLLSDRL